MLLRLFIAALWIHAGKGLTSWLLLVMFNVLVLLSPCGSLCQVWYLIVSFPDLSFFIIIILPFVGISILVECLLIP